MESLRINRILLENPILPPYRLAFFQRFAQSPGMDITFAYGQAKPSTALISISDPSGLCVAPLRNVFIGPHRFVTYQRGFLRLVDARRFDTVIATYDPRIITNLLGLMKARRCGMRWIWWGHGIRPRGRYRNLYLAMARKADACILYNEAGAEKLASLGIPREKMFIARNSIDTAEIERFAQPVPSECRNRVFYIGRLTNAKKVDLLVAGFAAAANELPEGTVLTIIGDGPERPALQAQADALGIHDKVEFVEGVYDQSALAPYFNRSWISVSPGGIGLSAIHSLAYGIPLLVADNEPHGPEIASVTEGVTGRFFPAGDATALKSALVSLSHDRGAIRDMGDAGIRLIREQYSVEAMVKAFDESIRYVAECRR
jgi:glycosyltransferase involved in cell wall biosynthesis